MVVSLHKNCIKVLEAAIHPMKHAIHGVDSKAACPGQTFKRELAHDF
ncbi:MAG TPA: hypothetical protein PKX38_05305 [Alphaproteobacteria bacterium]|nr:hypothetical protein [Micavibrio sp.]MBK9561885.1 hypothetical protein [Micavibrio sp.]HQX27338.1 hypothetical protein [Alphaproteobacteria bacterium]